MRFPPGQGMIACTLPGQKPPITNNKHTFKHCARSARQQQREHSAPHSKHKHKKGQKRAATGSDPRMSRLVTSSFNVPPKSNVGQSLLVATQLYIFRAPHVNAPRRWLSELHISPCPSQ